MSHEGPERQLMYSSTPSLTLPLEGVYGQCHVPTTSPLRKRPDTHCRGWVGPKESGQVQKISPSPGFDPRTVQPVASRYAGYVIPAHLSSYQHIKCTELKNHLTCKPKVTFRVAQSGL